MKKPLISSILFSGLFIITSLITILAGFYFILTQEYNPIINLIIISIGIINLVFGINLSKPKQWPYYSLILYLIAFIPVIIINQYYIYLKLTFLILDLSLLFYVSKSHQFKRFYKIDELDSFKDILSDSYKFTKEDTLPSWTIVISLIIIIMKFALFPLLTLLTGTSLPIVIVESCSMYHEADYNSWWERNSGWYEREGITKSEFSDYPFVNGMNKGDIILVQSSKTYEKGDVIIFKAPTAHPIIHRIVGLQPLQTKGDHNLDQIKGYETDISPDRVIGKAVFKIPLLGWIKLIFFEPFQNENNKGLCN